MFKIPRKKWKLQDDIDELRNYEKMASTDEMKDVFRRLREKFELKQQEEKDKRKKPTPAKEFTRWCMKKLKLLCDYIGHKFVSWDLEHFEGYVCENCGKYYLKRWFMSKSEKTINEIMDLVLEYGRISEYIADDYLFDDDLFILKEKVKTKINNKIKKLVKLAYDNRWFMKRFFDSENLVWLTKDEYRDIRDAKIKEQQQIAEREKQIKEATRQLAEVLKHEHSSKEFHI